MFRKRPVSDKNLILNLIKKSDELGTVAQPSKRMSTQLENPTFDDSLFQQRLPQLYRAILNSFRKISRSFALFNVSFATLFVLELAAFFFYTPFLTQPVLLAVSLSALFLTIFSYFIFLFYFQAKKPEQFVQLKEQFLASLQKLFTLEAGHRLSIAASLLKLAAYLDDFEESLYPVPSFFSSLKLPLQKLSAQCHWQDVFRFKQILLNSAIDEHLHQIRSTPTDLEVHASLANTYIALSKLFSEPKRPAHERAYRKRKEAFEENFLAAATLAMEELQILNHYAPNDPWVHEQLAAGYRDLKMPQEEIREVETLLKLRPHDRDLLFRLGFLYFEQGSNAKGLKIYEELKEANYKKAQDLIMAYGHPQLSRPFSDVL